MTGHCSELEPPKRDEVWQRYGGSSLFLMSMTLPQNCIPSHGTYEADIGNDSEIITYHASGAAEPARARKQKIVCFGIEVATLCHYANPTHKRCVMKTLKRDP